jgi:uncharacterized protein YcbX
MEHTLTDGSPADILGNVTQLYVYPVKSMRGVPVEAAHVGLNGIYGDRRYAFVRQDLAGLDGFPWMTGRQRPRMITYRPRFERPPTAGDPIPALTVTTPEGEEFAVNDPRLQQRLEAEYQGALLLLKSNRGNYDSQHLSLFSLATLQSLALETGTAIDMRQFRSNIYMDVAGGEPFSEDGWLGRIVQIGTAVLSITKKDTRCMMINLDPDSAVQDPQVLRAVARNHNEQAGIYANVMVPGIMRAGDTMRTLAHIAVHGDQD